jgi:asparagine synthase (glutamine-hydrolysing)
VTVVLDGQGGDELLAGYIPYYSIYFSNLWKRKKVLRLAKEVLMSLDLTLPFIKKFLSESRKDIGTKKMLDKNFASEFENKSESKWKGNDLGDFLYLEMTRNSLPRLLRYEDKNSMAFSVESRVPFLDHRIAEYVFSLPINQRIKNGWTKHLLRNAMKSVVPESVRKRRSKIGFAVPEKRWLLELRKDVKKKISSEKFGKRKYFDRKEIMKKFDDFCKGKIGDSYTRVFWRILILEFWLEVFFDKD